MGFNRELTRRDFLKLSAGSTAALGLLLFKFPNFEELFAASVTEYPVIWLQGGACSGCSVSVLNVLSPKIQEVLLNQVVPGSHVSLRFHPTIMAAAGELAMKAMDDTAMKKGGYILVVEGSVPMKDSGVYCMVGETNGQDRTMIDTLLRLGSDAMAVIAIGACSSFGGLPSAAPNTTGCKGVKEIFNEQGIATPVINLPGCPPHPDWFVGTVATVLIGGLGAVEVDDLGRPTAFYGRLIHDSCPRRAYFDEGQFAKKYSDPGCLFELGCKGPVTYADCPIRLWNSGTNWCVGSGGPCAGCANPHFPDAVTPLRHVEQIFSANPPSWLPPIEKETSTGGFSPGVAGAIGAAAGIAATAATAAVINKGKSKSDKGSED
jgi:hydrogenase small subunit